MDMRRHASWMVLLCAALLFSCEQQQSAKKPVAKQEAVPQKKAEKPSPPPAAKAQPSAADKAKKEEEARLAAEKARTEAAAKAKEAEAKKAAEAAANAKEAEARKAKEAEAKKAKEAEAKRSAEAAKARQEAAAKAAAQKTEAKEQRREAKLGRFVELGMTVAPDIKTVQLKLLGRLERFRGVEVTSVRPGSVAESAGLQKGDFVEGVCGRPVYRLDNIVDGLVRALPLLAESEDRYWTSRVAEGDAITRSPRFSIIRNAAQMDLRFDADTVRVNRANYMMVATTYGNPFAERKDILGGALFCEKRARHFKSFAFFGPIFEVKDYGPGREVCLLVIFRWREGRWGDVQF